MVELKKKVTLKTKVAETATSKQQESQQPNPSNGGNEKIGLMVVLAIIAVVTFFLLRPEKSGNGSSVSSQITSESVAQNTDKSQTQETEQPISESTQDEASTLPVEDNESDNKTSEDNNNESETVSKQEKKPQTITETKTSTKEATSKAAQKGKTIPVGTIEEKAKLVIRGDFGNGEERKMKLGSEYSAIQNKVNEMYAKGLVY